METLLFKLGLIVSMLFLVWAVTRNINVKVRAPERRGTDFYKIYNALEDRDETLVDRRERERREEFEDRTETLFGPE